MNRMERPEEWMLPGVLETAFTQFCASQARARVEWLEDAVWAAMLARLPVSHINARQLPTGGWRDEVVLCGGHVFASRDEPWARLDP